MELFVLKSRFLLQGVMPERALLRLKRAQITIYSVQKIKKNQLVFSVKNKDVDKVYTLYPKASARADTYTPYTITPLRAVGMGKLIETAKKRVGLLLGILLFLGTCFFADRMVFGVEIIGAKEYRRETLIALEEKGIRPFATYKKGKEDSICSNILAQSGVEFCSVKKQGLWVRVEIRKGNFEKTRVVEGDMKCARRGEIVSLTALSGTPLKTVGDTVYQGESLVGAWFLKQKPDGSEEKVPTQVIARALIRCNYVAQIQADDKESAFAVAYLSLGLDEQDEIESYHVEETGDVYEVQIRYTVVQRFNV